MAEYIEREKAIELIERYGGDIAVREIKRRPAADVRPERHGKWQYFGYDKISCSACSRVGLAVTKFCPNCGAKMDEEDGDSNG